MKLESDFQVTSFTSATVKSLLHYLYKDELDAKDVKEAMELLRLAKVFGFVSLRNAAFDYIVLNFTVDNALR